jgi:hypothetical protein
LHARAGRLALSFRADLATAELFARLAAMELDALLLRGPAIAGRLYEAGERAYTDCDLLVSEDDRAAIETELRALGYRPITALSSAQHWRRAADGAEIDLHLTLVGPRAADAVSWRALVAHRCMLDLEGTPVRALDQPATALVIALHAAQHGAVVPHTLIDLEHALGRWNVEVWRGAVTLATELDALVAFRQGLTMVDAGILRLRELGLEPALSIRSSLRRRGIELPNYLFESVPLRRRLKILRRRMAPSRTEMAANHDSRAEHSTPRLVEVHVRRLVRLPRRVAQLASGWKRALEDVRAFRRSQAGG